MRNSSANDGDHPGRNSLTRDSDKGGDFVFHSRKIGLNDERRTILDIMQKKLTLVISSEIWKNLRNFAIRTV